jgi:hypothetical protein
MDWLLFSENAITLGASTLLVAVVGFVGASLGTAFIQRVYGADSFGAALLKALLAGITVGIPLPVAGTAGGLNSLWGRSDPDKMTPPSSETDS